MSEESTLNAAGLFTPSQEVQDIFNKVYDEVGVDARIAVREPMENIVKDLKDRLPVALEHTGWVVANIRANGDNIDLDLFPPAIPVNNLKIELRVENTTQKEKQ